MLGERRASDGAGGRVRSGGRAGIVYRRARGSDKRQGLGRGLRETDCGGPTVGGAGRGRLGGKGLGGGRFLCAGAARVWGRLPLGREGVWASSRRKGVAAGGDVG